MFLALANAFAREESKNGVVYELRVAPDVYDDIATRGFDGHNTRLWGAEVVRVPKLRKGHVVLRYTREAKKFRKTIKIRG